MRRQAADVITWSVRHTLLSARHRNWQMHLSWAAVVYLLLLSAGKTAAQLPGRQSFITKFMADSLTATREAPLLFNTLTVKNTGNESYTIDVIIQYPERYQSISSATRQLHMSPGDEQIIPMHFQCGANAAASWNEVRVVLLRQGTEEQQTLQFRVRNRPVSRFAIFPVARSMNLIAYQSSFTVSARIFNKGNEAAHYRIHAQGKAFNLEKTVALRLAPEGDSTIHFKVPVSASEWRNLKTGNIVFTAINDSGDRAANVMTVNKAGSYRREHPHAYPTAPMLFESATLFDSRASIATQTTSLSGSAEIGKNGIAGFLFSENRYSGGGKFRLFNLSYTTDKLQVVVGSLPYSQYFTPVGYGSKITYTTRKDVTYSVYGLLRSIDGLQRAAGASVGYKLTPRIEASQSAHSCLEIISRLSSFVADNKMIYRPGEHTSISVLCGAGYESAARTSGEAGFSEKASYFYGYDVSHRMKRWNFNSHITAYAKNFPGLYRGQQAMNHSIGYHSKRFAAIASFQKYYVRQSYFDDTVFVSDLFRQSMQTATATIQLTGKAQNLSIIGGVQLQSQDSAGARPAQYDYAGLNYAIRLGRIFRFSLSGTGGYKHLQGEAAQMLTGTGYSAIQIAFFQAAATYEHGPAYYRDYLIALRTGAEFRRISGQATVTARMLKRRVNLQAGYAYFDYQPLGILSDYATISLSYRGLSNGLTVALNSNIPIRVPENQTTINNLATLSIRKTLNVPRSLHRKYHNLSLQLYNDDNGNGLKDDSETVLPNVAMLINKQLFMSDQRGNVRYANIDTGNYNLRFNSNAALAGVLPIGGYIQSFPVAGKTRVAIPFQKGRVVHGKIAVALDSLMATSFEPSSLKVTATGRDGYELTTFTEADGSYSLSLPDGQYTISLNPEAFDDQLKPEKMAFSADLTTVEEAESI